MPDWRNAIMRVPSVDLEMQYPAHPLPTAIGGDEEEGQQCWRDVEAETGFRSYRSFLEALPDTGPRYRKLLERMHSDALFGEVHVLEILKDGGVSISMSLQGWSEHTGVERDSNLENESKYCTQLLQTLRSPSKFSLARIIVWFIPRRFGLHPGLVDAIGLGLKIQPAIFATLLSMDQLSFRNGSCRRLGPDYVVIGNSIATVAQDYIPNKRVPPVLFVAKADDGMTGSSSPSTALNKDYDDMVIETLTTELQGSILPCRPARDMRSLEDLAPNSSGYLDRLSNHVLLSILSKYVQKGPGVGAQSDGPLLNAILPLLHLKVLYLHAQSEPIYQALSIELKNRYRYKYLDERRFVLRRMLEDLEDSRNGFIKFARLQNAPKWLKEQPWLSQEEEIIEAVSKARAVEAEVRDYMQLQIGNLSIEESRKSIQLSNQQMNEAKRVKIFTILAFIYVPINLATSVFGMNLQQLNQNGQNFWSFVVTAIVALLITGLVWFSLELYNTVVEHKHRMINFMEWEEESKARAAVRVATRLGLIKRQELDLIRNLPYE